MNQKKSNKLIVVLIIIIGLLIIAAGSIYVYLATDLLKTNRQLFFKYAFKTVEKNGLIEDSLYEYYNKQNSNAYKNSGNFNVNINGAQDSNINAINNTNISFSGEFDNANSKMNKNISINYSDSVQFPFAFKKVEDTIGVQTKYIGKKYTTIAINNINKINSQNLDIGVSSSDIKDVATKISSFSVVQAFETIQNLKGKYTDVIEENIQDGNFSKVKENGLNGYELKLSEQELNNITIKLLEILEEDKENLDKLNLYFNIKSSDIENKIEELKNADLEENNNEIKITVYEQNRNIAKIKILTNDINLSIEKVKEQNGNLQYNVNFESLNENKDMKNINFTVKYDGLLSLQNIQEDYELELEIKQNTYTYNISNNVNFENSINIEEFTEENSLSLDNTEKEQVNNYLLQVKERIQNINKTQMEELGLSENENLLANFMPKINSNNSIINRNLGDNTVSEQEQTEISEFNNKFNIYKDSNMGGGSVKGLLTTIALNNGINDSEEDEEEKSNNNYLIEEINYNGEEYEVNRQTIALLKGEISTEDNFRVEFESDENTGRIYRAVINKK